MTKEELEETAQCLLATGSVEVPAATRHPLIAEPYGYSTTLSS